MIQVLQNEWDTLMLETYSLKQQLHSTRQELAHSLYRNDAASRVIARLIQERDEARSALQSARSAPVQAPSAAAAMEDESADSGISAKIIEDINNLAKTLSKNRKKLIKQRQTDFVTAEALAEFTAGKAISIHSASSPGVFCLDVNAQSDLLVSGGADASVIVFNKTSGKIVDTLKGHKKKITSVVMSGTTPQRVFSTSADTSARVWQARDDGKYKSVATLQGHTGAVVGCALHPSESYLITASADKTWVFWDVETGTNRQSVQDPDMEQGYTCTAFHPDGLLFGAGASDAMVRIFDVKTQKNVALFKAHTGEVTGISFSENGYYLASGDDNGCVRLWDLRKLENFHTLDADASGAVTAVKFDPSGSYLGLGFNNGTVRMLNSKAWSVVKEWKGHDDAVTGFAYGANASYFATSSKDRTIKVFSS